MATLSRTESTGGTRRRGWWIEVLLGAALLWRALIAYAEWRSEGHYLWLFGATYDAGVVRPGTVIRHRVWVFNPTMRPLEIKPEPSCGCTLLEGGSRQLGLVDGFPLTVVVDTTGKPAGRQTQGVELVVRDIERGVSWREHIEIRFEVAKPTASAKSN